MTDAKALLALARAATPGPWDVDDDGDSSGVETADGYGVARMCEHKSMHTIRAHGRSDSIENARYIAAASPDAIVALCERVEAAESALRDALTPPVVGALFDGALAKTVDFFYTQTDQVARDEIGELIASQAARIAILEAGLRAACDIGSLPADEVYMREEQLAEMRLLAEPKS